MLNTLLIASAVFSLSWWLGVNSGISPDRKIKVTERSRYNDAIKGTFSPDGKVLALLGRDHVETVDLDSELKLYRIAPDSATMLGVRFSPDGRLLATSHKVIKNTQKIRFEVNVWEAKSGQKKVSLTYADDEWYRTIDDLSFFPDGSLLASNLGGGPRLWRTEDGTEFKRFPVPSNEWETQRVLLSPDGIRIAAHFRRSSPAEEIIRIWEIATGTYLDLATNVYRDWAFSRDSKLLAVTAIQDRGKPNERSAVEIWDVGSDRRAKTIEVPKDWGGGYVVAFSPDASMIAIGGYKKFGLFSTQNGKLLTEAQHPRSSFFQETDSASELTDIEFASGGRLLLTGGSNGTVCLWHLTY